MIRIENSSLDDHNGNIILRGVIDPQSFNDIHVGEYQRERRSTTKLRDMIIAIKAGIQLPDIEIGVRGADYRSRGGIYFIEAPSYIIDGLQRLTAAQKVMAENQKATVRLGAMIHFNTTERWERERFKAVNGGDGGRVAVSPNILLRNSADNSLSVATLLDMARNDNGFVLRGRVSWGQNKGRGEILTALTVLKTAGVLHSHFGPGRDSRYAQLMRACDKTVGVVGPATWRANVREFFNIIDQTFGIRSIIYADLSPHIKSSFLLTLAEVCAQHQTFWTDKRLLLLGTRDTEKLRLFPIRDPGIVQLIGLSGRINDILYNKLVNHMMSGRRINKMRKWDGRVADGILSIEKASEIRETDEDAESSQ